MEKSRAIELLKLAVPIKALTQQEYADFVEAVNMGMDALEYPTSPDTIDRKAALDALMDAVISVGVLDADDIKTVFDVLPSVQQEKVQLSKEGATSDLIRKFIDGLEEIFADLRERHVDDSVCGLCEYDGAYMGQSGDWCNECPGFDRDDCFKLSDETRKKWTEKIINALPTIQPEPQWIPVSERLPEDLEEVNVTWVNRNPESYYESIKDKPFTATAVYYKGKWYWWSTYTQDLLAEYRERCSVGLLHEAIEVTAWMPLPEAYNPNK